MLDIRVYKPWLTLKFIYLTRYNTLMNAAADARVSTFELPNLSESLGNMDWIFLQSIANIASLSSAIYFAMNTKSYSVKDSKSLFCTIFSLKTILSFFSF